MLYHWLAAPHAGVDVEQVVCTLREPISPAAFRSAWEQVSARHRVLRTRFCWDETPVQEVLADSPVIWVQEDWSAIDSEEQHRRLGDFLQEDRQRGFDLGTAPFWRLTLLTFGPDDHRLVWTFHHAILDGRSFTIVLREVFSLFDGIRDDRAVELPSPRSFDDFAVWRSERKTDGSEAFWRTLLNGISAPTLLPLKNLPDCSKHAAQGDVDLLVSKDVTSRLLSLCEANAITLNTLLQGAWAILLSRYSGEIDVVFGATRACRHGSVEGSAEMVGLLINTLPVRVQVEPDAVLLPWLKGLRAQWVEMREHEHTPLTRIQSWSDVPGDQPLFDTLVVYEKSGLSEAVGSRNSAGVLRDFRLYEQTGLGLTLTAFGSIDLLLRLEFNTADFSHATATRILGHVAVLLESIAANPEQRIGKLPLLTAEEREELLFMWNLSGQVNSPEATLHELFAAQAGRTPDAVALTCDGKTLTYAELEQRSNALAAHLQALGAGPETIVGLRMERTCELVVGLLAILKAGGAYLPIDLSYPPERVAFMLTDAEVSVLLTESHLVASLREAPRHVVCLDQWNEPVEPAPVRNAAGPDSLAYVIYTSGSTGQPKGCLITHRNVVRLFSATEQWFRFDASDVWTMFHSVAFDFSVWEIWGALLYGGRLVIVPHETSRSPEAFRSLLASERVTVLNQTPSAFRQLIAADEMPLARNDLALRFVIFGGEALELQSLKPWFARHGDARPQLVNMYGITETTVHVTYRPISADDLSGGSVIGIPIPDLQLYVLDPAMRPVPVGVPGEMYVGGGGVARGYLRRPELSAERFLPNSFTDDKGAKLYRTGDLARWLPGRDLEYLGRIDHQVKIRGFRIELGEIESALCSHPRIREAVVTPREERAGDKRLVAYVVPQSVAPSIQEIREHLKIRLPEYMIPAAFVMLERIPLTNNGKVDRKALPAPESARTDLGSEFIAPRTHAEETLARIWSDVLRVERVGIHDNFFALGGDSILSILIVSRARQAGLPLSPRHLFKNQTIAELAVVLSPEEATPETEAATGDVPWTPIQRWFLEHDFSEAYHWNQAFVFRLTEALDQGALEAAARTIAAHHDVFRLRFQRFEGSWRQSLVETSGTISCSFFDCSQESDPVAAMTRHSEGMQASLDLEHGPLLRIGHFDLGPRLGVRLVLVAHHLIVDGVSWRILMEDLEAAYDQVIAGREVVLPSRTTTFTRWARTLQRIVQSPAVESDRRFWQNEISSAQPLPLELNTGDNDEASAETVTVSLTPEETETLLQRLPATFGTRINDALLAALGVATAEWSGRREILVDVEGHGREDAMVSEWLGNGESSLDLSRTLGWFTTIYPVALQVPTDVREALLSAKEKLRTIPHRGFTFGILRYLSAKNTQQKPSSPAEILFNYLGQFEQTVAQSQRFRFSSEPIGNWHSPRASRTHLLEINCLVTDGALEARWQFSTNRHRRETIAAIAERFIAALREMLREASGPRRLTVGDLPLAQMSAAGLEALSAKYPDMEDAYPLAPLQHLYFTLELAQRGSGIDQWHCVLKGNLDVERFREAWNAAFRRHTILRTGFVTEDSWSDPLQVVRTDVRPDWRYEDWRELADDEREARFNSFLRSDAAVPFDLSKPPLTRLALFRTGDVEYRFVWTHHHLQIDGWSWPRLLAEVSESYAGKAIEDAPSYREYVGWLHSHGDAAARSFWEATLQGFTSPVRAPLRRTPTVSGEVREIALHVTPEITAQLQQLARNQRVTLNVVVQAALAVVLARYGSINDIVFGASFSGRPADVSGLERTIGPFVTNLPVRAKIAPESAVTELFQQLQEQLLASSEHQFTSLSKIQSWSEVPWNARLFETLFVFQNYEINDAARRVGTDVRIENLVAPIRTNLPLTIVAVPGPQLQLTAIAPAYFTRDSLTEVLESVVKVLGALSEESRAAIADLLTLLPPPSAREENSHASSGSYLAPQTPTEKLIANVWSAAFGRETIGIQDNFFDLGGHSLLMLQVHRRLVELLPARISIARMFQHPTIQALARHIDGGNAPASPQLSAVQSRAAQQRAALARQRIQGTRK